MKKICFLAVIVTAILFATTSCKKEAEVAKNQVSAQNSKELSEEPSRKVTITISWDEWGRAKRDCKGWGLCNFKIEIIIIKDKDSRSSDNPSTNPYSAELYYQRDGRAYIDVLIDKTYEGTSLFIDEDLYSVDENGQLYMIPEGEYKLNPTLGKMGGYTVPVIIVEK
jgi:hypothetical protein